MNYHLSVAVPTCIVARACNWENLACNWENLASAGSLSWHACITNRIVQTYHFTAVEIHVLQFSQESIFYFFKFEEKFGGRDFQQDLIFCYFIPLLLASFILPRCTEKVRCERNPI